MGIFSGIKKAILPAAIGGLTGGWAGAGAGLLKGLGAAQGARSAASQAEDNYERQKEFAQYGIRWKVADAQAAGLHPVYALGGSGAAFAPNPITVDPYANALSEMGQSLLTGLMRNQTQTQARQTPAPVEDRSWDYPVVATGPIDPTKGQDLAVVNPVKVDSMSSAMPGVAAGPAAPGMYLYNFAGSPVLLPGSNLSEAVEAVSESPLILGGIVFKANQRIFGRDWGPEFLEKNVPMGETGAYWLRNLYKAEDVIAELPHIIESAARAGKVRPMPPAQIPGELERLQGRGMTREQWKADEFRRRNAVGPSRWRRN